MDLILVNSYGRQLYEDKESYVRKHFQVKELANLSGDKSLPMLSYTDYSNEFYDMLEEFRCWFNKPMKISSNYRQVAFNSKVGGDKRSAHLYGCAVDWVIEGHTKEQRQNVTAKWEAICKAHNVIGAINYYSKGYHLEAFSDQWYGNKVFKIRDYIGTSNDWK